MALDAYDKDPSVALNRDEAGTRLCRWLDLGCHFLLKCHQQQRQQGSRANAADKYTTILISQRHVQVSRLLVMQMSNDNLV